MADKQLKIDSSDLIYTEEFIEMLGGKVTKRIIYNWIREKKIPAFKVGNRYVFSRKRVDEFIAKKLGIAS
ncbi:MAG: helix-turn-helix domain-containing protein [Clostridia bacterium]|nr:helix-turn-helix domain-containing protein [Clostridia bacterium]